MIVKINGIYAYEIKNEKTTIQIYEKDKLKFLTSAKNHLTSHKNLYIKSLILTGSLVLGLADITFASGISEGGERIYYKLVEVGKWVIIIKGGIDIINTVAQGDFQSAKKQFMGYGLIYALLFALPWMLDEIEAVFKDL